MPGDRVDFPAGDRVVFLLQDREEAVQVPAEGEPEVCGVAGVGKALLRGRAFCPGGMSRLPVGYNGYT